MSYLALFPSYRCVLSLLTGMPVFNYLALIWGESLNSGLQNWASKTRNITPLCGAQNISMHRII